jgi:flagellar basal body-associated protein FliL
MSSATKIFLLFYCRVNHEEVKDKQKKNVIVIVLVALVIAVVFGVLLIPYCIYKRTNTRGNITFSDQHWKRYCMIV